MSCWTSVRCSITCKPETNKADIEKYFGKELILPDTPEYSMLGTLGKDKFFELMDSVFAVRQEAWDDWEKNKDEYLPTGSEGSLKYHEPIKDTKRISYIISGNLRDKFNAKEQVEWYINAFLNFKIETDLAIAGRVTASDGVGEWSWRYYS